MFYVNINWKSYPFSQRATNLSRTMNYMTSWPFAFVAGLMWISIVDALLVLFGMPSDPALSAAVVSVIALIPLWRMLRAALARRIDKIALADLMALRDTNPPLFEQLAASMQHA